MQYARSQFRAAAISYALLGTLFLALAIMLVGFSWSAWNGPFFWHEVQGATAGSVALYTSIALGFWILAWLSLRYVTLSPAWRIATLAASVIPALWSILGAVKVTITGTDAMRPDSGVPVIGLEWLFALVYALPSYLLWKHRRARG